MKLLVGITTLLLLVLPGRGQSEYLDLPWSSLGDCKMEWVHVGEDKTTWAQIINQQDTIYYSAYHEVINLKAEQIMQRLAKAIQPNYYLARFTIMKNRDKDDELEYALFAIESKEFVPTGKPLTTIYMIAMGKEKSYIISLDLPTHKLTARDKKKWKAFFQKARLRHGDIQEIMALPQ